MAMPEIYNWLRGGKFGPLIVPSLLKRTNNEQEAKSLGLRYLMHYMGDIH